MKVIIFGATGMVGKGVLLECLDDPRVDEALLVSRHSTNVTHRKVHEIFHDNFFDFTAIQAAFAGADACFFCLGVSSVGMPEADYYHLTYDLTLAAASAIAAVTDGRLTFCYVSGEGTDSTERGRRAWARIKGKTENAPGSGIRDPGSGIRDPGSVNVGTDLSAFAKVASLATRRGSAGWSDRPRSDRRTRP